MPKIVFLHGFYLGLRSWSKVGVKIKGQGQGNVLRSRSNFWHAAVDIRGPALLGAAKSNISHYQSRTFVCNQWAYADNHADAVDRLLIVDSGWPSNVCALKFAPLNLLALKFMPPPHYLDTHNFDRNYHK